jgi:sugar O-acyltransferase (sialic acid O-acetyltransferase NeuD family)
MNFIFGSAGFAKEVHFLIRRIKAHGGFVGDVDYFVTADSDHAVGTKIKDIQVIPESEYFERFAGVSKNCFIGVGNPDLKRKIAEKLLVDGQASFPSLVDPSVVFDDSSEAVVIGNGVIICANSVLTTDIKLGDFVYVNLDCTVGHDCQIGAYTTLSPGVHVSGRVQLGREVFAGTGAVFLEQLQVTDRAVVGAGAVVARSIDHAGTYVGIPAKLMGLRT